MFLLPDFTIAIVTIIIATTTITTTIIIIIAIAVTIIVSLKSYLVKSLLKELSAQSPFII